MKSDAKSTIEAGKAILGIEFGSTRIKAVLIDQENKPIAQGSHTWENQLVDGLWTYSIEAIWAGLQDCYADLRANVKKQYGIEIETLAAIGISAMMHGYMPFNDNYFDKIIVLDYLNHTANCKKSVKEINRVLKDGGEVIVEDLNLKDLRVKLKYFKHRICGDKINYNYPRQIQNIFKEYDFEGKLQEIQNKRYIYIGKKR